jgi:two-component system, chemotaxis family, sensor kinase CheA
MGNLHFGLGRKLLVVCLAFGLPIAVMSVLMTQAKLGEIDFAEKEKMGDAMQRPLEDLLQHTGRLARQSARAERGEPGGDGIEQERAAMEAALAQLEAVNRKYGEALQFTEAGLGLRDRREFTVAGLRSKWQALLASQTQVRSTPTAASYRSLVQHLRTMITHAGDTSNLILDPDLDSYYLMDVTLLTLPQMEERIQQIASQVDAEFAPGAPEEGGLGVADLVRFATLSAFLREADWERVRASTTTAFNEDQNFHGTSATLRTQLAPHLAACAARVDKVVASLDVVRSGGEFNVQAFRSDLEQLDDAVYAFHRTALDEEDRLISRRIEDFTRSLQLGLGLAAGSVLVSALLAFALSTNILRRLYRLSLATKAVAEGDLAARVGPAGSDEIGQLAGSFDAMTTRIGGLTAEVQQRASQLEQMNGNLEQIVSERTHELQQRNHAFRLILDNVHDGMLTVDLAGVIASERSAIVDDWFGTPVPGIVLGDYLGAHDPALAVEFALGLEQVAAGFLPIEVTLDQLPRQLLAQGRHFRIAYEPIVERRSLSRILVVLSDVTAEMEGRQAIALQEDVLRMIQACQRDRSGFLNFFVDARELVSRITDDDAANAIELRRAIHTLKGNSGLFGVLTLSKLCHEVENSIAENGGQLLAADVSRIKVAWSELSDSVAQILGDAHSGRLEVDDAEYAAIVDSIVRGTSRRDILDAIARWRLDPAERRLQRLAEQARALASRMGKEVEVSVLSHNVRLCAETWAPVWSALSHAIRNAVDHGIEPAHERALRGLPRAGRLHLETRVADGRLLLEIADDGQGVDWNAVAEKARSAGLPCGTSEQLMEALFLDGISTRDTVTETSGRGVGMAVLRRACQELGGHIVVMSRPLEGTTIRCSFPEQAMAGVLVTSITAQAISNSIVPAALQALAAS